MRIGRQDAILSRFHAARMAGIEAGNEAIIREITT